MNENLERILIDEKTLKARIAEMGAQISRDYAGEELVVIGLLKGAAYFLTELTQHITVPVRIDFIKASSYGSGTTTSGKVDIDYDTSRNIAGKNVLLSGETVNPVAVSMVLAYAEISNSVSIRFHQEPGYFCSVTHDPKIEIGHMFPTND